MSECKFLVVDDNDLVRGFLLRIFKLYDLPAEFATNGKEAIEILEKEDFTAVLMDLEMPVMGGLEATRIIRQREKKEKRKHTPIIAVSGTSMNSVRRACSEAGVDEFIAKPMRVNELLEVILPLAK